MSVTAGHEPPTGMTTEPRRRRASVGVVPTVLLAAIAGLAVVVGALIAADVGPLEVHPQPRDPGPPRRVEQPRMPPELRDVGGPQRSDSAGGEWLWWVGATLAVLVAVVLLLWLVSALRRLLRRPARPAVGGIGAPVAEVTWSHLAEPAQVDVGDGRRFRPGQSADDIVASWELVEAAADAWGYPRLASTTPTEFLQMAIAGLGDPQIDVAEADGAVRQLSDEALGEAARAGNRGAAAVLLHFYHRARFDTVALTPGAATAARRAAHVLLDSWERASRGRAVSGAAARVDTASADREERA